MAKLDGDWYREASINIPHRSGIHIRFRGCGYVSHLHLSLLPHLNPLSRPQSSPFLSSGSGLFRAGASWKGRLLQSKLRVGE